MSENIDINFKTKAEDTGLKTVKKGLKESEEAAISAGDRMRLAFNKAKLATAAFYGDLQGIGEQLMGLLSKMKLLGGSIGKIPGLVILAGITALFSKVKEMIDVARERIRDLQNQRLDNLSSGFDLAAENAERFNRALERTNRTAKEGIELARARRSVENEIAKQGIDKNRRLALAGSYNEREEYETNRRFDAEQRAIERKDRRDALATEESAANLDAEKIRKQLENERKTLAKQIGLRGQLAKMQGEGMDQNTKDTYWNKVKQEYGFADISVEDMENMIELDKKFGQAITERNDKIKELEAQWGIIQESLKNFKARAAQIDAEESAEDAETALKAEMERRRRNRASIEQRNRKEDQAFDESESARAAQRRESERGAGYGTLYGNAEELLRRREEEFENARQKYEGVLSEIGGRSDDEITPELKAERDRRYEKYRQAQERKREAQAQKADLEFDRMGALRRDDWEQKDREEQLKNARREEMRQRVLTVFGDSANVRLANENVKFHEDVLEERQAEFDQLKAELAGKYGRGFSISDLGSLDRERFARARGRVWESEDSLRDARFEKDKADYTHMIEADRHFRDISMKGSNRLTAMGLAGGGFSWGDAMSKDTRKLVSLTEKMLSALNNPKEKAVSMGWGLR